MKNPHDVLGLLPSATLEEIKTMYHKLARKYLEEGQSADPATARLADRDLKELNEAYALLSATAQRPSQDLNTPPPLSVAIPPVPTPPPAPPIATAYTPLPPIEPVASTVTVKAETDDITRHMRILRWLLFIQGIWMAVTAVNAFTGQDLPPVLQKFSDTQYVSLSSWFLPLGIVAVTVFLASWIGLVFRQRWARTAYFGLAVFGYVVAPMMFEPSYIEIEYQWYYALNHLTTLFDGAILTLLYFSSLKGVFSKAA